MGDPAFVRHIKIRGSGETTYPLYNIKRGGREQRWHAGQDADRLCLMPFLEFSCAICLVPIVVASNDPSSGAKNQMEATYLTV